MLFGYTPIDFENLKLLVQEFTGLAKDALHVYAGLSMFIIVRLLWRWRGGWIIAWAAAVALACGAEWLDILAEANGGSLLKPDPEHWHDIWNTSFWPSVLLLVGPWLAPAKKSSVPAENQMSGDLADHAFQDFAEQPPSV